jgi:hypothetical protein
MSGMHQLPEFVFQFIEVGVVAEFATLSAAGVPIDTPTYYFPSDEMATIDLATNLIHPAKAERARRNPKVGLLMEGSAQEPVVSIRGYAAVRDTDFEANARRYIAETGFKQIGPDMSWEQAREAVQYWTRIIIEVTPARIAWWSHPAAMDAAPQVWNAPSNKLYPRSDPAPPGRVSQGIWSPRPWQEIAQEAIAKGRMPHLTVCDEDGFPMPIRVRSFQWVGSTFRLELPQGLPWRLAGKATLSFEGFALFVGEAAVEGELTVFQVERALPQNMAARNPKGVLRQEGETLRLRQARLEQELARRGKPIPGIPLQQPAPTRLATLRVARIASGAPITGFPADRGAGAKK